jgi:hypothetical protein
MLPSLGRRSADLTQHSEGTTSSVDSVMCKVCGVVPRNLGKGNPLRVPRCIPSGLWRALGIEPQRASQPYRRLIPRKEIRALPAPIASGGLSPPPSNPASRAWRLASPPAPGHAQSTGRLTASRGASALPRHPMARGVPAPSIPASPEGPTVRRLDARHLVEDGSRTVTLASD